MYNLLIYLSALIRTPRVNRRASSTFAKFTALQPELEGVSADLAKKNAKILAKKEQRHAKFVEHTKRANNAMVTNDVVAQRATRIAQRIAEMVS